MHAQFKTIQGSLGGQYENQNYNFIGTTSSYDRYRQLANVGITGYLYNPNVAEFNLQTRFINTNSTISNVGNTSKERNTYLNYYDFSADLLRSTRYPLSVSLKRDVSTIDVSGEFVPSFSNKILTNGHGFRFSPSLKGGSLNLSFNYDGTKSESLNPLIPLNQFNRTMQLGMDMSVSKKTNIGMELIQRDRQDYISQKNYRTREVQFRGFTQPDDSNHVSVSANFLNESQIDMLNSNMLWNSQMAGDMNNQVAGQFRWSKNFAFTTYEGQVRDQLDIGFSPEWRGLFILSHSEGRMKGFGVVTPLRTTTASAGVTHLKELERYQLNFSSHATYNRFQSHSSYQTLEGIASGAIRTKGFSLGQVSLAEQVTVRRWLSVFPQTLLQNSVSTTIESNAIPFVFLHTATSYLLTKDLTDRPFRLNEKNLAFLADATYRWSNGIVVMLTLHYGVNRTWSENFGRSVQNYGVSLQLPNILDNLNLQGRVAKTFDRLLRTHEFTYDADITYSWRAIAVTARWVGYSFYSMRRNDVYITLSRPFRFDLE
ncbi:MAG: hypothetical protein HY961_00995 [Ignavibacteriae bacterium]|nr:hypothetical protein [Ignavibacteriota bacterium]